MSIYPEDASMAVIEKEIGEHQYDQPMQCLSSDAHILFIRIQYGALTSNNTTV